MSDCIHFEVCGSCDIEPSECGYYEQRRGECQECHATEAVHKYCKYSVDRGWCDDTCKMDEYKDGPMFTVYRCSACCAEFEESKSRPAIDMKFCPNCGRRISK